MPSGEAEPEAVFSPERWAEIAQSIPLDELPWEMKKEICDALFAYELGFISNEESEGRSETQEEDRSKKRRRYKEVSKLNPDASENVVS